MLKNVFSVFYTLWETNLLAVTLPILVLFVVYCLHWFYRSQKIDEDLGNLCVLITGCDTGFGNRTALKMDKMGLPVFAACLTEEKVTELTSQGSDKMVAFKMDVTNDKQIEEAVQFVTSRLPNGQGLWALINNAGIVGTASVCEWLGREHFKSVIDVNCLGMVSVTKAFLPLVERSKGRIINMTSTVGRFPIPPAPYSVSKFCAEAYTDCLRRKLLNRPVSVHTIEPGGYRTNITNASLHLTTLNKIFSQLKPSVKNFYGERYKDRFGFLISFGGYILGTNNLDEVTDVYISAVLSKHPKTRYVVGLNGNLLIRPLWTLPTWIVDFVIGMTYPRPQGC